MIPDDELHEQEQIEQYLLNRLPQLEKEQIETKLRQDSSFAMKVESTRQLMRLIQTANAEKRVQDTLRHLYRQKPALVPPLSVAYRWAAGAVAACLAVFVYLTYSTVQLPIIEDDLLVVKNSANANKPGEETVYNRLLAGQEAIKRKNYIVAENNLEAVLKTNDMRPYYREAAQWSLTVAYLYSDQPRKAEGMYQQLREIDNPEYEVGWVEQFKTYVQIQVRKWL